MDPFPLAQKITELFNFRSEIFTETFFMNLVLVKLKVGKRVKEVLSQVLPASQYSEFKAGNEYFDITVIQPTKNIKFYRSVCKDLPAVQQAEDHEEKDAHQEEDSEPRFQRVLCLRLAKKSGFQS